MRLLVVEDDPLIGRAVVNGLREGGYAVDWVHDGAAAELALATPVYDLVVLDLGLPRKDGLELLRGLRRAGNEAPTTTSSSPSTSTSCSHAPAPSCAGASAARRRRSPTGRSASTRCAGR
jgi:DNA-binding response OmpR family regulator